MKVHQLIEKLQKIQNKDLEVLITNGPNIFTIDEFVILHKSHLIWLPSIESVRLNIYDEYVPEDE